MVLCNEFKEVHNPASRLVKLYARPHVEAEDPLPPLGELIQSVLDGSNAAMRPIEICVALIEAGKAIEGDPTESVGLVLRTLRDHPDRFRKNADGYWKSRKNGWHHPKKNRQNFV